MCQYHITEQNTVEKVLCLELLYISSGQHIRTFHTFNSKHYPEHQNLSTSRPFLTNDALKE